MTMMTYEDHFHPLSLWMFVAKAVVPELQPWLLDQIRRVWKGLETGEAPAFIWWNPLLQLRFSNVTGDFSQVFVVNKMDLKLF